MKSAFEKPQAYLTWHAIPPTWEDPLPCGEYLDVHDTDGHKNSDGTDCWPVYAKAETPATDAFLAEVRASAIPEGYVLVPQEMHLSSEAMEGICFHCGDGDHKFGEFTDGTLFVGEVDYGDGKKVHGLHIATADYPEEGCATICDFATQIRKGVQS
ncbi:hypothetical protein [Enterobacter kobei]|uniref:hypothetical protein n=1 Tax=Enterobacter kobei TaxID=208224 RepID=UPI003CE78179